MSANQQAFVQNFSRRKRRTAAAPPATAANRQAAPTVDSQTVERQPITRVDRPESVRRVPTQAVADIPVGETRTDQPAQQGFEYLIHGAAGGPVMDPSMVAAPTTKRSGSVVAPIFTDRGTSQVQPADAGPAQFGRPADLAVPTAVPQPTDATPRIGAAARVDHGSPAPPTPHHHLPQASQPASPAPQPGIERFRAVWEVDVFDVPANVADLFFDAKRFGQIAERMFQAVQTGLKSILITSVQAGEGRSSVAIGIAMAAAASGVRVALVDADAENPTLADHLRLDLQYGWVETIRGGLPINEIAVAAVEDGVTLIPLMPPLGQTTATSYEAFQLIERLKDKFELIVIDGPPAMPESLARFASAIDTSIIVRDVNRTVDTAVRELSGRMQSYGIQGVGVVDNFV